MRKLLILAILAAAIAIVIFMTSMRPQPPRKERVELDPLVEIMVLEAMTEHFEVRSQGTVEPRTETVLSAEVSGTVTWISPKFVAGGVFEKGEVLLRIDPTNYDVALKQAEATEEASSAVEQMTANVEQTAQNAMETKDMALKSASGARDSGAAVLLVAAFLRADRDRAFLAVAHGPEPVGRDPARHDLTALVVVVEPLSVGEREAPLPHLLGDLDLDRNSRYADGLQQAVHQLLVLLVQY